MAAVGPKGEIYKVVMTLNEEFSRDNLEERSLCAGCGVIQDTARGVTHMNETTFIETLSKRFDETMTTPYTASADIP